MADDRMTQACLWPDAANVAVDVSAPKEVARTYQKRQGFTRYAGPKLEGPRIVLDYGAKGFPRALMGIPRPPKKLYVVGNPDALQEGLAVIGARKATPYGLGCARRFARIAAQRGICIISGGARGCDSQAHRAALEAGAPTVVFLGGGCNQLYPAENFELFQGVVAGGGAVVSELEWDHPPMRHTFRERNRLIAGLARATLIVEAGLPSGTFSTADEALAASRDVLVVPGSITSPYSAGANRLLYQGATPVVDDESFEDCLHLLYGCLKQQAAAGADGGSSNSAEECDELLAAVLAGPCHVDALVPLAQSRCGAAQVVPWLMGMLTQWELEGLVAKYPNGSYGPSVR